MDEVERHLEEGRLSWESFAPLELSIPLLSVSTASDEDLDLTALESFIWAETA